MKKILKTEGTSKTYGQFLISKNTITTTKKVSFPVKIVKTTASSILSGQTTKNDPIVGKLVDDIAKNQIILAAANSKPNSTVVIQDTTKDVSAQNLGNPEKVEEIVSVLQSETLAKDEVLSVLLDAQKIDLFIAMRSLPSDPIEYNTLQMPQLQSSKFVYQNWDVDESNLFFQEDPSQDPLLNQKLNEVPKYVEFIWDTVNTIEQTTENTISKVAEIMKIKDTIFNQPRGIGRYSAGVTNKPISNSLKNVNLVKEGAIKGKIVDIHDIEKGFDSVSNKHEFVNSVQAKIQLPKTENSLIFNLMDIIKK